MKPITLITNTTHEFPEEDQFIAKELSHVTDVTITQALDPSFHPNEQSRILIRNVWPTAGCRTEWTQFAKECALAKTKLYNPFDGMGDQQGKSYLADLFNQSFPVIPTITSSDAFNLLPPADLYWIKPFLGEDGSKSRVLSKQDILLEKLSNCIIQPYLQFIDEPSLYFIDGIFAYAVTVPHRINNHQVAHYEPSHSEILLAKRFVDWNALSFGLQRIDFVRLADGSLMLMEIEDFCPYLYLLDLPSTVRKTVVSKMIDSLDRNLG